MGQKSSKPKNQWDVPPPGMFPYAQNPYANPPFIPPGYQPTPGPYAAFPSNAYGQAAMGMPQPQLNWLPQDKGTKKSKSRRSRPQSEQYGGGYAGTGIGLTFPEPNPPQPPRRSSKTGSGTRRRASESAPPSHPRRSGTPFIPPGINMNDDSDSDASSTTPPPPSHRRTHSAQPGVTGRIGDVLRPITPPGQAAFGPTGERPRVPLRNPLPPPPRDLYEMTPYKSLLTLPQTTALLTASYNRAQNQPSANPAPNGVAATTLVIPPGGQGPAAIIPPGVVPLQDGLRRTSSRKGKGVSGLFRALSGKRKTVPPPPPIVAQAAQVQFIPVYVDSQKKPGAAPEAGTSNTTSTAAESQPQPPAEPRRNSVSSTRPPPPQDDLPAEDATPILFDQVTQNRRYYGFMNHSPHRVMYKNKVYPTATHLHEALKYLPEREEIADEIRATVNVLEVYEHSAKFAEWQRQDWAEVFMDKMEEVLVLKFRQHADLREMLVGNTGERPLVYTDPLDGFWGIGPSGDGANELGKVLMRVRRRLREEGGLR